MRGYAKISPQFWIGDTGRKLRDAGQEAMLVGLYLLSNPHANMLGLYYLPKLFIAHETGLGLEGASKGLRRAIEAAFCSYDEPSEMVFVHEMARYQIADRLAPTDKQCAGIQREYKGLPNNPFLSAFYEKYTEAFHLTNRRGNARPYGRPSEGASMPLRSQEQEQEQEKTISSKPNGFDQSDLAESTEVDQNLEVVWSYYLLEIGRNPKLYTWSSKRKKMGEARLRDLWRRSGSLENAVAMMKLCIDRLKQSKFHNGANDQGKKYIDWEQLFRSTEQMEKWLNDDNHPTGAAHGK